MKSAQSFLTPILLCGLSLSASAGGKGTSAAGFLKAGAGARASAMGEAYSALADEAGALYWNPAALTALSRRSVTLMHAASVESTAYSYAAYGQKLGDKWGLGLGVQHQTAGSLTQRDATGAEIGSLTPTDTAFSLGAARTLGPVALGVTAKMVQSKIIDSASAMTGDVGVLCPGLWGGKLNAALTATNVVGKIKYEQASENLPSSYRLGLGFKPSDRLILGLDAVMPKDNDSYVAAGLETVVVKNERFSLAARGGYNMRSTGDVGGLTGATFGLGFGFRGLGVDYAFLPMGDLGATHRVSLSYSF